MNLNRIAKRIGIFGVHTKMGYKFAEKIRNQFGNRITIVGFLPKRYEYYMCKDKGKKESVYHKEFHSRKGMWKIFDCLHYHNWPYKNKENNDAARVIIEECLECYIIEKGHFYLLRVKSENDMLKHKQLLKVKKTEKFIKVKIYE